MYYSQHAREALLDVLDRPGSTRQQVWEQLRRLADCTDTLPGWVCTDLEVVSGSSYAQAAANWRDHR